jgi:hypothetical protein
MGTGGVEESFSFQSELPCLKNITFFLMLPETVGICHGAIFKAWFGVPGTYTQPGFFKTEGK